MQTDHFGNDPRGVSAHTQLQIDEWQCAVNDLSNAKNHLRLALVTMNRKHGFQPNQEYIEAMFQNLDDAYYKDLTDLENRIGR